MYNLTVSVKYYGVTEIYNVKKMTKMAKIFVTLSVLALKTWVIEICKELTG